MSTGDDQFSRLYNEDYFRRLPVLTSRIKNIVKNLNLNESDAVCEFGCGVGHVLIAISQDIQTGLGIDFSEYAITEAEKNQRNLNIKNLTFRAMNIEHLVSDRSLGQEFNKVLMLDVTEHIYDETLSGFLASARHILKRDGELYIHTPNADYYLERLKAHDLVLKQLPGHIAVRCYEDYQLVLNRAGFGVKEIKYLPHYNRVLGAIDRLMMNIPYIKGLFRSRIMIKAGVI